MSEDNPKKPVEDPTEGAIDEVGVTASGPEKASTRVDDAAGEPTSEGPSSPVVVGIGASAGGLEAFQAFFDKMPSSSGMSFVVVSHLDPTHESMLADLLGRHTAMEVTTATDGAAVEPNCVYVIPPDASLDIEKGRLRLSRPEERWGHRSTIDHFFAALAQDVGGRAVGIILSGTGSDGTVGLRAVKAHGGMTMAQSEDSAKYYGMPASAAASGQVDHVLPVEEMPAVLIDYVENLGDLAALEGKIAGLEEEEEGLERILHQLRAKVGHDFGDYKRSTMARRVQRRKQVLRLSSWQEYLERLKQDEAECRTLFQDLLIGVTRFFRDPEAFEALGETVVPAIFSGEAGKEEQVRVWVPGCASGEEAYSLAILLCEHMKEHGVERRVQIFASDIDERSLEVARSGVYPAPIADTLSPERLETYFHQEGDQYRVVKRLREMIVFSRHDLIQDPPFSRLDLISCRNLLIYFDRDLQERVLPIFHYALRDGGFLFLGPSEGGTVTEDLFVPVGGSSKRIFRARETVVGPSEHSLQALFRPRAARPRAAHEVAWSRRKDLGTIAERVMFDEYGPPFVVVNSRDEVVHFSGRTGAYLEPPEGAPTTSLLGMARHGLGMDLRALLRDVRDTDGEMRRERVGFRGPTGYEVVDLIARPLPEAGRDSAVIMVVFQQVRESAEPVVPLDLGDLDDDSGVIRHLEQELQNTREHLQSTIEELETSNEELKSSNEELLSMNEELQSTNEELQTSKEELQSTNEELETVNAEFSAKLEELASANSDLKNLFESTQIATVFLDPEKRIKRFTPSARGVFQLIPGDVGRPLSDITGRVDREKVLADVDRVMEDGEMRHRQVRSDDGSWFILRVRPYVTVDGEMKGTVLTLVDVSDLKSAQEENVRLNKTLNRRVKELETILDLAPVGIAMGLDAEAHQIRVNRTGAEILGLEPGSEASKSAVGGDVPYRVLRDGEEVAPEELPMQKAGTTGEHVPEHEYEIERSDGRRVRILMQATPLLDRDGKVRNAVGAFIDVTEHQQDRELVKQRAEQQAAVAELGVAALSTTDMTLIFQAAIEVIRDTLGVPLVKLLEYDAEGDDFLLRGGTGWRDGLVGEAWVRGGRKSQAGYTVDEGSRVIVSDVRDEDRFEFAPLLEEHGVISGVSVVVRAAGGRIWGVMGAHSREPREFSANDVNFMQAVANVLGAALEREHMAEILADAQKQVALQNAKARLRRAERLASVGTLAAGIAHEITNPVNSILMTAETALMAHQAGGNGGRKGEDGGGNGGGEGPLGVTEALERIVGEAERCGVVVRDVLDFSRAEHTRKARRQLNEVVEAAIERCLRFIKDPPEVATDFADGLPDVMVAPLEMEQVLVNLLRNAVEAGGGGVEVHVSTSTNDEGWPRLVVRDEGPGMEEETLAKVFDPFFTTRRRSGGTGLGLSLVHSIISDHDGNIDVQSAPGEGTRFIIDLPPAGDLEALAEDSAQAQPETPPS